MKYDEILKEIDEHYAARKQFPAAIFNIDSSKISWLINRVRILTEALERINKPNMNGVEGMIIADMGHPCILVIQTLEGEMRVLDTDYVIKGVRGEFYPCKEEIFEETYEAEE